jgi:polynucleotide 5'-hydroxyl-kinase GRC3/NOL9
VCALSTHALPVIRCLATDINGADIRLRQCENGLRSLSYMSPLYGRIWNDDSGPIGPENSHILRVPKKTSFQIVCTFLNVPEPY